MTKPKELEALYKELEQVLTYTPCVEDCTDKENLLYSKAAELKEILFDMGVGHHKPRTAWIMGICDKEYDDVIMFRKFYASDPEEARKFVSGCIDETVEQCRFVGEDEGYLPESEVYNNGVDLIEDWIIGSMVDRDATILYSAVPEETIYSCNS